MNVQNLIEYYRTNSNNLILLGLVVIWWAHEYKIEKLGTACRMKDSKNGIRTLEYDMEIVDTRLNCLEARLNRVEENQKVHII